MPRCAGQKGDGTPCERIVGASREYCYAHDPTYAEERSRSASKAARSPARARSNAEVREIKGRLKDLYAAVLEGRAERAAAAVANQIANTQLRAIQLEIQVQEQNELEEQLDALETMLEEAERGSHVSRR